MHLFVFFVLSGAVRPMHLFVFHVAVVAVKIQVRFRNVGSRDVFSRAYEDARVARSVLRGRPEFVGTFARHPNEKIVGFRYGDLEPLYLEGLRFRAVGGHYGHGSSGELHVEVGGRGGVYQPYQHGLPRGGGKISPGFSVREKSVVTHVRYVHRSHAGPRSPEPVRDGRPSVHEHLVPRLHGSLLERVVVVVLLQVGENGLRILVRPVG